MRSKRAVDPRMTPVTVVADIGIGGTAGAVVGVGGLVPGDCHVVCRQAPRPHLSHLVPPPARASLRATGDLVKHAHERPRVFLHLMQLRWVDWQGCELN
jgi:hypothetical protein